MEHAVGTEGPYQSRAAIVCRRPGTVAAVDIPPPGGQPRVSWRAEISGTPTRMLAADGKLLVVTAEGSLYCFGGKAEVPRSHPRKPLAVESPPDQWVGKSEAILEQTGVRAGYCVALGLGSGRLVDELARRSKLHLIVIESDADRVAAAHGRLHAAGLYGSRIHIVPGDLGTLRFPPLMANLIVSENLQGSGLDAQVATMERLFGLLRPYGGIACLPLSAGMHAACEQTVRAGRLAGARIRRSDDLTFLAREGALPGAADWMHESGEAAHTYASQDRGAKPPFGVLWFGGEVDRVLPLLSSPVPRIAGGRMFLQTDNELHAARHLYRSPLMETAAQPDRPARGHRPRCVRAGGRRLPADRSRNRRIAGNDSRSAVSGVDRCLERNPRGGR